MSLIYRYTPAPMGHSLPSLSGRTDRPRPFVPVWLMGPSGIIIGKDGLLDTAADDTVFPEFVAVRLGIDLSNAPIGSAAGVAASPVSLRYAEVTLRLATPQECREWRGWVGFTAAPLIRPLLGYAGCLQFFDAVFRGAREEVELTINHRYQGT